MTKYMLMMLKYLTLALSLIASTALAADYYVNPGCSAGCDRTTLAKGWDTLAAIVDGDLDNEDTTLWISGGSSGETYAETLDIDHTTTNYTLTIRPMSYHPTDSSGHDGLVTITGGTDRAVYFPGANNVTLEGKTTSDCTASDIYGSGCQNIKIQPLINIYGIEFGTGSSGYQNLKIRYIELTGMDENDSASKYAIRMRYVSSGGEIAYNYIHDAIQDTNDSLDDNLDCTGSGNPYSCCTGSQTGTCGENPAVKTFYVDGYNTSDYGQIAIHHNYVSNPGIDFISGGPGVDAYNNYFYNDKHYHTDIVQYVGSGGKKIQYFRFYKNLVGALSQAIFLEENNTVGNGGIESIRIYDNVFWNSREESQYKLKATNISFEAAQDNSNIIFANNTFVSPLDAFNFENVSGNTYTGCKIVNNIVYEASSTQVDIDGSWTSDSEFVFDYNAIYNSIDFTWQNSTPGSFTNYTAFTGTWATDHPTFSHNVNADPTFVSASDFRLQSGSSLRGAGVDTAGYTDMPDDDTDINGVTRSAWDIGAYEFQSVPDGVTHQGVSGNFSIN